MSLDRCIFQVMDSKGQVRGTSFAIGPTLVVTCAHVVKVCNPIKGELFLVSYPEKLKLKAEILNDGWNLEQDVAFLRLKSSLPSSSKHIGERLGSFGSKTEIERGFRAFGSPKLGNDIKCLWAKGLIKGQIWNAQGAIQLQLESQDIAEGMSGAPVMDDKSGLVVGMVQQTNIPDPTEKYRDLAYALSIEVLSKFSPEELTLNKVSSWHPPLHINMAPTPEHGFIERDAEYEQLIEGLLYYLNDTVVAITTALRGAGGYGKTTLAKTVCHDPKIKDKFPDGILWVTLGENPKNLIGHIQDLIYFLSGQNHDFEGLDAAISCFKNLLHEKCILLVIDDVWDSSHLEPFMQGGSGCVRLITTRINEVLPEGSVEVRVDAMKNEEAVRLLRSGLTCNLSDVDDKKLDELAKRLGYWPLLLKIVNSALKQLVKTGNTFKEAIDYVNDILDREKLTSFDPHEKYQIRNNAVGATIKVSLDFLKEDEFERYKELAIFPEDEEIHLRTLTKLWGKTANYEYFDVKKLCYKLFNLSLLQTYNVNKKIIKLHDVMRKYLNDIQQQKVHNIHSQFLEAYEVKTWVDLPEDETYLWENLSYHLIGAERREELRKLLFDFNWIQSKLNVTGVHFLVNDYDFFHADYPVEMVKGSIQLSANALSKDKKLLDGQLLGRLEFFSEPEIKLLREYIRAKRNGTRILPLTGSLTSPGGPLLRTLEGHFDWVNDVSITSDGNYVVSASSDRTLKVWDLKTGKEVHTIKGHSSIINAVSVTHGGNYVVSASDDRTLKVWNLKTGEEVRTLTGHSNFINAVSVTLDGNYVVSASDDETLKVWDLKTGEEVRTLTGHSNHVRAVSITSDGNYVISASSDKTLKVWNLKKGKEVRTLAGHSNWVNEVSITPDDNYAISASSDRTLKVWDIKKGKEVRTLTGHSRWVEDVSITPDGNYAISASNDRTLKIWDIKKGKEVRTLLGHSNYVRAVSITPDGKYVVSASSDRTLKIWDIKKGKNVSKLTGNSNYTGHSNYVRAVSVTPDGKYVVSASSDRTLKVWDIKTGEEIRTLEDHSNWVNSVSITPDGNYAVSASSDRTLKVWNIKTGKKVRTLTGHAGYVRAVSITSDGNYAVSASDDCTLKVWNLKIGKEVRTLTGQSSSIKTVSVIPNGNYAVSASDDGKIKVWDLKIGTEVRTLKGHSSFVNAISVTPDGNYVVSASADRMLKVWNLKTGEETLTLEGHSDLVNAVSVSPDGNYAVSASSDRTLKVWDLKTGKEISAFSGESPIYSVTFSLDGTLIVAGEASGRVHFLQFERGSEH